MAFSARLSATCLVLAVATAGCTVTNPEQNAAANATSDQLPTGSHLHRSGPSTGPSNVTTAGSVNNTPVPSGSGQ